MSTEDRVLYISLGIGFLGVALLYFYPDYSTFFGGGDSKPRIENTYTPPPNGGDETTTVPTVPKTHTVKSGESVELIAATYELNVQDLIRMNPGKIEDTGQFGSNGKPLYKVTPKTELILRENTVVPTNPGANSKDIAVLTEVKQFLARLKCDNNKFCNHDKNILRKLEDKIKGMKQPALAKMELSKLQEIDKTYFSNGYRKDEYNLIRHPTVPGDDVYAIAREFNNNVEELLQYNSDVIKARKNINGNPISLDGKVQYEIIKKKNLIIFVKKK